MPDIRDLICTAERLQANGFTRRAATAWRVVATHPAAPAELRERIWRVFDGEPVRLLASKARGGRRRRAEVTDDMRQIANRAAQGEKAASIAADFGVSARTVFRVCKAVATADQRGSLPH